jgi:hypothetical protein
MSLIFWLFLIVACDMILREQKPTPPRKPWVSMAVPKSPPGRPSINPYPRGYRP